MYGFHLKTVNAAKYKEAAVVWFRLGLTNFLTRLQLRYQEYSDMYNV